MSALGLVAYNSSDESDDEHIEETGTGSKSNQVKSSEKTEPQNSLVTGEISDEDDSDYQLVHADSKTVQAVPLFSFSTSSSALTATSKSQFNKEHSEVKPSMSSLADLPAPRARVADTLTEDDELEDEVKPKPAELVNAQKPPTKKKQPVRISVPSLDETPLDEDESSMKKPTPSKTKSGLFGLLPPPIHSAKKEINRPLIPHTLTKKPPPKAPRQPQPSKIEATAPDSTSTNKSPAPSRVALNVAMYGSDSEEEEEVSTSNFFSLNSSSTSDKGMSQIKPKNDQSSYSSLLSSSSSLPSPTPPAAMKGPGRDTENYSKDSPSNEVGSEEEIPEPVNTGPEPGAVNDAPLNFGHRTISRQTWSASSSHCHLDAVGRVGTVPNNAYEDFPASNAQYNMANTEASGDQYQSEVGDDDLKQFMSEKEFQRFSGKRKRGQEEAITFVDANVDDYVDPSEVSKHLTEETEYVSHKNKDNMPTAQQKRKKQITYLAYQAKEKELELKNTWANNRMTKRQTQSKYGF